MKKPVTRKRKFIGVLAALMIFLTGCAGLSPASLNLSISSLLLKPAMLIVHQANNSPNSLPQPASTISTTSKEVPAFKHVIWILLENHNYKSVVANQNLPTFSKLAKQDVLFTNYYAVAHPSLPNYIALIAGSTLGVSNDCSTCFLHQDNLANLIQASDRSWKVYEESMPTTCYLGYTRLYDRVIDPFIYFNSIRTQKTFCQNHIVPFSQLSQDLKANQLPNFVFITPNMCHNAHYCSLTVADTWLGQTLKTLQASPALGKDYAIFIVFDESRSDNSSCCGLGRNGGGHVPAFLVSPLAKHAFQDSTPLDHYSLLKTVLLAWNLPPLGLTGLPEINAITSPWKK